METRFKQINKKYEEAVNDMNSVDLSALKTEIESFVENLRSKTENSALLNEAEDMLIDVTRMIEETHCRPLKCSCK